MTLTRRLGRLEVAKRLDRRALAQMTDEELLAIVQEGCDRETLAGFDEALIEKACAAGALSLLEQDEVEALLTWVSRNTDRIGVKD